MSDTFDCSGVDKGTHEMVSRVFQTNTSEILTTYKLIFVLIIGTYQN